MSVATPGSPSRSLTLHGLRGALALGLFFFHVANSGLARPDDPASDLIDHLLRSLEHGVELFFCISGVVIVQSFRTSPTLVDFAWNRVTRIYPVLWITVSVIAVLSVFRGVSLPSPGTWLANLLALPPLVPLPLIHPAAWSISYEFAFYGLFVLHALLHRWLPPRVARASLAALVIVLVLTHLRAASFLVGLALAWRAPRQVPAWLRQAMAWLMTGIGFAYLGMGGVLLEQGALSRWLKRPLVQWLGTVSFSLYLWQTIVMALVKHAMSVSGVTEVVGAGAQLCFLTLSLAPTLWVSHLSQRWLENTLTQRLRQGARVAQGVTP